jgi:hypothetical protein
MLLQITILLTFASQVASITGVSQWCLAMNSFFLYLVYIIAASKVTTEFLLGEGNHFTDAYVFDVY